MGQGGLAGGKKNSRNERAVVVFADESGLSLQPFIARTWAPRGQTPVVKHSFSWKKLSMCAALVYRWDGKPINLYFEILPGAYNGCRVADFLSSLHRELRGRKMIVIWDGLPAHRSSEVQELLEAKSNITVTTLPAYAPNLNPTEYLWSHMKRGSLANFAPSTIEPLYKRACQGALSVFRRPALLSSFTRAAGLFFCS